MLLPLYNYILFVDLLLFLLYFSIFFGVVVLHFRRLFIILFVCTESLTLVSDPTSRRFIRWLLFQTFIYIYARNIYYVLDKVCDMVVNIFCHE